MKLNMTAAVVLLFAYSPLVCSQDSTGITYDDLRAGFFENARTLDQQPLLVEWTSTKQDTDQYKKLSSAYFQAFSDAAKNQSNQELKSLLTRYAEGYRSTANGSIYESETFQCRVYRNSIGFRKELAKVSIQSSKHYQDRHMKASHF